MDTRTKNRFRTPQKAYGFVTQAEEMQISDEIQLWTDRGFRTAEIEPEKIIPAIQNLYRAAGFQKPPAVIVAQSPLAAAYIYGAAAAGWHREDYPRGSNEVGAYAVKKIAADFRIKQQVFDPALKATQNAVGTLQFNPWPDDMDRPDHTRRGHRITDNIRNFTSRAITRAVTTPIVQGVFEALSREPGPALARLGETMGRNITDGVMVAAHRATPKANRKPNISSPGYVVSEALESAYAVACFDMGGELAMDCAMQWNHACQGGNTWAAQEAAITAMRDIIGLRFPELEPYTFWEAAAIEGGMRICHEQFCVVSDFPEFIKVDEQGLPHCESGPSHRWRDGWALYHWHGVSIPGLWLEEPGALTAKDAMTRENLEQRRAACEILGWARILEELDARVIDEDADPQIGTLLEVTLPGVPNTGVANAENITARFIRVQCGTGRTFAICVHPGCETAIEAQAWMVGLEPEDFLIPEVRA